MERETGLEPATPGARTSTAPATDRKEASECSPESISPSPGLWGMVTAAAGWRWGVALCNTCPADRTDVWLPRPVRIAALDR
jgi:hypothetical protein